MKKVLIYGLLCSFPFTYLSRAVDSPFLRAEKFRCQVQFPDQARCFKLAEQYDQKITALEQERDKKIKEKEEKYVEKPLLEEQEKCNKLYPDNKQLRDSCLKVASKKLFDLKFKKFEAVMDIKFKYKEKIEKVKAEHAQQWIIEYGDSKKREEPVKKK